MARTSKRARRFGGWFVELLTLPGEGPGSKEELWDWLVARFKTSETDFEGRDYTTFALGLLDVYDAAIIFSKIGDSRGSPTFTKMLRLYGLLIEIVHDLLGRDPEAIRAYAEADEVFCKLRQRVELSVERVMERRKKRVA